MPPSTIAEIDLILADAANPKLTEEERAKLLAYARKRAADHHRELCQNDFFAFFKYVRPHFLINWHHLDLAKMVQRVEATPGAREMINLPPRTTKSKLISVCGIAWMMGRHPEWKFMELCVNQKLAGTFGRETRDLVDSEKYREIFPDVKLNKSDRSIYSFATKAEGSQYLAVGIGGNLHGHGGDVVIIDDPIGDQTNTPQGMEEAYNWYTSGPRLRLQPGARILAVMSRWPGNDLCARLVADQMAGRGDTWNVTKIPAYTVDEYDQKVWMWPDFWGPEEMEKKQRTTPPALWNSQYMQEDVGDDGVSSIPENRWRIWPYFVKEDGVSEYLPATFYKIQAWDTAFTDKKGNSASACTTWGVFYASDETSLNQRGEENTIVNVVLLDCYKDYVEFPMLKRVALNLYRKHRPDEVWIEGKASGKPLMQDLKRMGLPLHDYTPVSGETKSVRLAAVADLFTPVSTGRVWTLDYHQPSHSHLYEVILQCQRGPSATDSDLVDSCSMGLRRFRKGNFLSTSMDDAEIMGRSGKKKRRRTQAIYG